MEIIFIKKHTERSSEVYMRIRILNAKVENLLTVATKLLTG